MRRLVPILARLSRTAAKTRLSAGAGHAFAQRMAGQIARRAFSLAAQIRSFSVSPPAAWVVKATSQ